MPVLPPRALTFDVFGTLVDWRSSVARAVTAAAARQGVALDAADMWARAAVPAGAGTPAPADAGAAGAAPGGSPAEAAALAFAAAWRAGYAPAMQQVRSGVLPWLDIDALHRIILDRLLEGTALGTALDDHARTELNYAWHRLDPWPDVADGLRRLGELCVTATLSNGNVALLVALARHGNLRFDAVLSAQLFRHYKPDPEVYLGAAELLGCAPGEVMMVAAHTGDLRAAAACGLRTAYVHRPYEHGPGPERAAPAPTTSAAAAELVVDDLPALAAALGA